MTQRLIALALFAVLAACKPQPATDAPATPAAAPAAASGPSADRQATQAAARAAIEAINAASAGAPTEGVDYVVIAGGRPYAPLDGKIEVVEIFNYVCPACARFNPLVEAWRAQLPPDVRFTMVPAAFNPTWVPYARAFLAAEQTPGLVDKTHDAIFEAIHLRSELQGERGVDTDEAIAKVYARYGVDPAQFAEQMRSFAVDSGVNRARQFLEMAFAGDVAGTPTLVVNGKYRIKGTSYEDVLRIANQLIARERQAAAK